MWKKNKKIGELIKALKKVYPEATCALKFSTPFQLLVATILSAQCTDERVNKVTPGLFKKYPTAREFARVPQEVLENEIRSTGFFRNKARNIRFMAQILEEKFGGGVPPKMEDLILLPGVARKTANVVLGTAFGIADGIVVDTHVIRLARRLGLSSEKIPEKIEKDLMEEIPKEDWIWFAHALITHGRKICTARHPQCAGCPVLHLCANPEVMVSPGGVRP